jgi:hypothetical protein
LSWIQISSWMTRKKSDTCFRKICTSV